MKKRTCLKALALTLVVSMGLTLTACYVPPDEITDSGYTVGSGSVPWQTVASVTDTPVPTVEITAVVVVTDPPAIQTPQVWVTDAGQVNQSGITTGQTGSTVTTAPQVNVPTTQAASRTPTPAPTVGSLKLGSKGDDVRALQRRLTELGYYRGDIDGQFGSSTEQAVMAFQRMNKLTADGKAGANTLNRINSANAIAATAAPTVKGSLKLGASGAEVRTLQRRLQELGYYTGTIDGDFGATTEKAVKAFQRANGLTADGKVGDQTWAVLNSPNAVHANKKSDTTTNKNEQITAAPQAAVVTAAPQQQTGTQTGNQAQTNTLPVQAGDQPNNQPAIVTAAPQQQTGGNQQNNDQKQEQPAQAQPTATIKPGNAIPIIDNNGNAAIITAAPATEPEHITEPTQPVIITDAPVTEAPATAEPDADVTTAPMEPDQTPELVRTPTPAPQQITTAPVTLAPGSTATPRTDIYLSEGKTGKEVTTLQARLIELGYLSGKTTGSFSGATDAAVRAFQKRMGLWVDGKAGPDTLSALYSSNAKYAAKLTASIGETLKLGMQGADVRALQSRLRELGYLKDSADGSFGENTRNAVMAFQRQNGLLADGEAGPNTLNLLYANDAPRAVPTATPAPTLSKLMSNVSSTGYIPLRDGDNNAQVSKLQSALKDAGYYDGPVDGQYGTGTESAVIAYQAANYLKMDGVAGPATQRLLYGTDGGSISYAPIRPGESGTHVANVQYTLYELGFFDGAVNGVYDETTQDAVREFQALNQLRTVDGIAGNDTLQRLYSSSAISATRPNDNLVALRLGDVGESVLEMKSMLMTLGYLDAVGDNTFDDATYTAILLFQNYNGLKATGIATPETQRLLYAGSAVANREDLE